jgi:hypothetical protein
MFARWQLIFGPLAGRDLLGHGGPEFPAVLADHDERDQPRARVQGQRAPEGAGVLHHDAGVAHVQDAQPPHQVVAARVVAGDRHLERPALVAEFLEAAPPFVRARP